MPTPRSSSSAQLTRFLAAATRAAAVRSLAASGLDLALLAGAVLVAASWAAGVTLRGDLAQKVAWLALGAGALARVVGGARSGWRAFGNHDRTARSVARYAAPLGSPADAAQSRADRGLRHEILGAFELTRAPGPSVDLAVAYTSDVAQRIGEPRIDPRRALPTPRWRGRAAAAFLVGAGALTCVAVPTAVGGLALLLSARDGRPPAPPAPVWSSLTVELRDPAYTRRPPRVVPNPSGALRVVAGTEVILSVTAWHPASAARAVLNYDPAPGLDEPAAARVEVSELSPTPSEGPAGLHFTGAFTARGSGSWTLVLLDRDGDEPADGRRSASMPLLLEPDRPPDVELVRMRSASRPVRERQAVDVRFVARDDFGVQTAQLAYQLPDGTTHRLSAGSPPGGGPRVWRHRFTWDLASIPIQARSQVLYWVEVRDNDPGLGLIPLPDPPGKLTRSATATLLVEDDESEHAANIHELAEIRDRAVDLLGARMVTPAFSRAPVDPNGVQIPLEARAAQARELLSAGGDLLTMLAQAIDALTMDTLTHERDVAILARVHRRLKTLHDAELELHTALPPGLAPRQPREARAALAALGPHNREATQQLEDEVIRIDDLVDGQVAERLEALVARLEATQRKLVELLEQLKAGDETARAQIEQLEQRRRDDLRRIAEARAMLREEVNAEFMNLDAFEALEALEQHQQLAQMLRRGETDEALEAARDQLGSVQQLRDAVQEKLGHGGDAPAMSPEERQRMELLRELSRIQDELGTVRSQTRTVDDAWRAAVEGRAAARNDAADAGARAASLRRSLEDINDARLGREGRRGLEDAQAALQALEAHAQSEQPMQLELDDAARRALDGVQRALAGSEAREREGRALRRAVGKAEGLRRQTQGPLPTPDDVLEPSPRALLDELARRQRGLRTRAAELTRSRNAKPLPPPGRQAMRTADRRMESSADELAQRSAQTALREQSEAWDALQQAIDSLRQGPPPPPPSGASSAASTETDRDRSLRDQLMDAMKEKTPDGYAGPVQRYYEELLR